MTVIIQGKFIETVVAVGRQAKAYVLRFYDG